MSRTPFGIIGCGSAAVPVCQALAASRQAELGRLFDVVPSLAADLSARFGAPAASRLEDLLEDNAIQAVYLAVPHDQLFPLARQILAAGKHALVEKPMALTLAQADELIALAERRGLALGVFYQLRHSPSYARARDLVRAGAIGTVIGLRIQTVIDKAANYWQVGYTGRTANPWRGQKARAGGGVALMNSSHQLDAIRYITGLEVVSVSAETATLVAAVEVEDVAAATLRYDNGAIGSLFAGAHMAGAVGARDECFAIYGTLGQLQFPDPYGAAPLHVFLRQAHDDLPAGAWRELAAPPADVHALAVEAFAGAVRRGEAAPTSGHDARRTLATILAVYQSAAVKRSIQIG